MTDAELLTWRVTDARGLEVGTVQCVGDRRAAQQLAEDAYGRGVRAYLPLTFTAPAGTRKPGASHPWRFIRRPTTQPKDSDDAA